MGKKATPADERTMLADVPVPKKVPLFQKICDAVKKVFDTGSDFLSRFALSYDRIFAALIASVLISYIYQLSTDKGFTDLNTYYNSINTFAFFAIAAVAFVLMIGLTLFLKLRVLIPWLTAATALIVSVLFAAFLPETDVYLLFGVGIVDLIFVLWLSKEDKLGIASLKVSRRAALIAGAVMFVAATVVFGYFTSLKYRSYTNFTFDFGIFAQMYERMAQTFEPNTTVERSYMMSHFGVHFSPIFYLFLPGYYIFRSPIYLFYVQSAAVAGGIFAVYLICGKLGFSGKLTLAMEALYAFYPCLFNGTFYDFHENKFLTTIILFLFYFILAKKPVGMYILALLLLMVKEDAAIYLIVIALFVILNRREYFSGITMLIMAVVYFIIAQRIVSSMGDEGVMMSRLQDYFINGEQTFTSVLKSVFFDMGYLIKQMFTAEKLPFILWMFAPVVFAPFLTKKISSLILLLPINLMQSWKYQYDVNYQYTYGVAALILIASILVIAKLSSHRRRVVVLTSLFLCVVMSTALVYPKIKNVTTYMDSIEETREEMDDLLDSIPEDASVTAAHGLVPHLYRIEWLYTMPDYNPKNRQLYPEQPLDTDYFAIDTRYADLANDMRAMMGSNYDLQATAGFIELYKHK